MLEPTTAIYVERVNATIDYIESHLDEEMRLAELAAVAHFSPYHFHRIFTTVTGETLGHFVNRTRLERAASLLVSHPHRSITEIATECGFLNPSSFARAFRGQFAMSATEWRRGGHRKHKREIHDDYGHFDESAFGVISRESAVGASPATWRIRCGDLDPTTLTIETLPPLEVAYVRYTGRYQGQADVFARIFDRLMSWAEPRGLISPDAWVLAVYHDNPSITDDAFLRVSACISVPADTPASGDIGRMRLTGGSAAVAHFELGDQDYPQAWRAVMGWLLDSGYEPDDRLPYERYFVDRPAAAGRTNVDICLPVRPLRSH
jgi:AraC family transcriptional regulator